MSSVFVSLWVADLDVDDHRLAELEHMLDGDERARAESMPVGVERRRFVVDHGLRRVALGGALGVDAAAVRLIVDASRRPSVAGGGVGFSASRDGGLAVCAIATGAGVGVGVDVEEVHDRRGPSPRTEAEDDRLAARIMSPAEHACWLALDRTRRPAALAACWTRKEAYGKAVGTGLVFPLAELEVWAGDDRPVRCGDVAVRDVDLAGMAGSSRDRRAALAVRIDPERAARVEPPRRLA